MQAYFVFVIFAIVLATVVEINGHAVHLLHAVRPRPEYPRDVGNFEDKFHSIDAVRPDDNYIVNARLLKDSLHADHANPSMSHVQNGMSIARNPLFMRDKRSELKKKKRKEKTKEKKTKAGKNKGTVGGGGDDDKESAGGGGNKGGGGDAGNKGGGGGGGKKGKKN